MGRWDVLEDVAARNTEGAKSTYVRSSLWSADYLPRLPPSSSQARSCCCAAREEYPRVTAGLPVRRTPAFVTAPEAPLKFRFGMSQADLGEAAVMIGGSVLSGMKTLGGIAFSPTRAGVNASVSGGDQQQQAPSHKRSQSGSSSGRAADALGMLFSKSARAGTASPHEYQTAADCRRRSLRVSSPVEGGLGFDSQATVTPGSFPPPPTSPVAPAAGCNVTVVDLHPLLSSSSAQPEPVAQFTFPRPQALSALKFSPDGTSLALCSKDGHAICVLQLRPASRTLRQPPPERTPQHSRSKAGRDGAPQRDYLHVLDLAKGHLALDALAHESKVFNDCPIEACYKAFNLGKGKVMSVLQIIEAMCPETKFDIIGRK